MMTRLRRWLSLVTVATVMLVAVVVAIVFYEQNATLTELRFLQWSTAAQPLWVWLLASLVGGFGLGALVMSGVGARLAWRARSAERTAEKAATALVATQTGTTDPQN